MHYRSFELKKLVCSLSSLAENEKIGIAAQLITAPTFPTTLLFFFIMYELRFICNFFVTLDHRGW